VALLGPGPDHAGHRQRLLGVPRRSAEPASEHQPLGVVGQHPGPLGRRCGGQDPYRLLQLSQAAPLVAGLPAVASPPHVQQCRAHRVIGRVELRQCRAEQRKRGLVLAGGSGGVGRPGQQLDPVQSGHPGGVRHLVPQLQSALVVAFGLREGMGGGDLAGPDPRWQRLGGSPAASQCTASSAAAIAGETAASSGCSVSARARPAWSRARSPGSG